MLKEPIPYHPALCRVLGGVTISIVLVYLEIHHSPPEPDMDAQPARAGLRIPPVSLDCDQACDDLGVSRRTLDSALHSLGVWWKLEAQRAAAARSGRDFLNSGRSFPASSQTSVRPYAIVGSRQWNQPRTLTIHRNSTRLEQIAIAAGISQPYKTDLNCVSYSDTSASGHSLDDTCCVLESALEIGPAKVGIAWGWSDERRRAASERMTAKWLKWREIAHK